MFGYGIGLAGLGVLQKSRKAHLGFAESALVVEVFSLLESLRVSLVSRLI